MPATENAEAFADMIDRALTGTRHRPRHYAAGSLVSTVSENCPVLERLAQLRDSGALTNEEFETQKAKLLAEM